MRYFLPYGFEVEGSVVILMFVAFLQAGTGSMWLYMVIGSWGGQMIDITRVNRGRFSEFAGTVMGALFGASASPPTGWSSPSGPPTASFAPVEVLGP